MIFMRPKYVEALFTLIAGILLVLIGLGLGAWLLAVVGVWVVLSTRHTYVVSTIAAELKPQVALGVGLEDEALDHISRDQATAIIRQLRSRLPKMKKTNLMASTVRNIWERMHGQSLGWLDRNVRFLGYLRGELREYATIISGHRGKPR